MARKPGPWLRRSLKERGFSSPLRMVQTGPTAWFAPIFPYLLAGIFKLFGVYSYASNLVIQFLRPVFFSVHVLADRRHRNRAFGRKTGIAAAWTWVFLPTAIFYPVVWVWDTALAALWMAMLVAATMQLRGSDRLSGWVGYGALWSAGAMINPSLIAVLPPLALWAIWPLRDRLRPALKLASASALIFAVGIARGRSAITSSSTSSFRCARTSAWNCGSETTRTCPTVGRHGCIPTTTWRKRRRYARMTEIPYMEEKEREAWASIRLASGGHRAIHGSPLRQPLAGTVGFAGGPVADGAVVFEADDYSLIASSRCCRGWGLCLPIARAAPSRIRSAS